MSVVKMQPPSAPDEPVSRRYRFPPFPPVPKDVKIIAFKDFKEYGTGVVGEDKVEQDGLGIRTIALPKRKKEAGKKSAAGTALRKEWWEDWEASIEVLRGSYDPQSNRVDRLRTAITEFAKDHAVQPYLHLQQLWDTFKGFVGLNDLTAPHAAAAAEVSDNESDYGDESNVADQEPSAPNLGPPPLPDADDNIVQRQPEPQTKTTLFLDNPTKSIEVFLSSYMHERGQMWNPQKLVSAPHLLRFFVRFLLHNNVLPESTQSLQDALDTIELAGKELPFIPAISNALPDAFSAACQLRWGRKTEEFVFSDPSDTDSGIDQPTQKRQKIDHGEEKIEEITTDGAAAGETQDVGMEAPEESSGRGTNVEAETKDIHMDVGSSGGGWGKSSGGDWGDTIPSEPVALPVMAHPEIPGWDHGGWGANTETETKDAQMNVDSNEGGWGGGGWGEFSAGGWGENTGWGDTIPSEPIALPAPAHLEIPSRPTLLTLLGPSAFPLTHVPGVVEWSLRRIKSVTAPDQNAVPHGPGAEAVERALERRMHRLVLEPWVGPNATADAPHILRSSVGALAPAVAASRDLPKPHDLLEDEITVLVEAEVAGLLSKGMGLGGTWVQLARVQDQEESKETNEVTDEKKKLTKGQKLRRGLRYWYIDELLMVLPSYWAV